MGADWPLVQDALVIAAIALSGGAAIGFKLTRLRRSKGGKPSSTSKPGSLEERVQVLERIATDRSSDLAEQIETLRYAEERK